MSFSPGLDAGAISEGASYLTRPAEEYVNADSVESMWVMRTIEFADIHFNLISSVDPKLLKLTKTDDKRIYSFFKATFPSFSLSNVTEDALKSGAAKEKWRAFCEALKDIEDYSFGTLLRLDCTKEYSEENTILVTRIQFLAIEIARNIEGYNDYVYNQYSKILCSEAKDEDKPT